MILITGAAGPTGQAVLRAALQRGMEVRALVHRPESAEQLRALGGNGLPAVEVVAGDLLDVDALALACAGIQRIYHICPNFHPAEVEIGKKIIDAAQRSGVEHFVYHSVLHPAIEAMPHHWEKMRVEEMLFASDLPCTIVQPGVYMQNLRANLQWQRRDAAEKEQRALRLLLPYRPEARISLVDIADVGEVAALLLAEERESGGVYPLVGTPAWSQHEIAQQLSERFQVDILAEELPLAMWRARNAHLDSYKLNGLTQMFAYYDLHGLSGSTRTLRLLLGREPASFKSSIRGWTLPA